MLNRVQKLVGSQSLAPVLASGVLGSGESETGSSLGSDKNRCQKEDR